MTRPKRPGPVPVTLTINSDELAVIVDALEAYRSKIPARGRGVRPRGWIDFDKLFLQLILAQRDAAKGT